ncbi:MAG: replication-associated recombination protein A [Bacteriovoracaceae bacterium]|nr:replication-associated recombination protein A [Bacteriovoracaceae bacterium]
MNSQTSLFSHPTQDPLAHQLRPKNFDDYRGQEKILKELENFGPHLPHLVLWGPPGTGKTTLAHLLAQKIDATLYPFNAVMSGIPELKKLIVEIMDHKAMNGKEAILFIDEIHRFNKSQQDALLPYVERGDFFFIGATTEYPQTSLNKALLSRVRLLELKSLSEEDLQKILQRAVNQMNRLDLESHIHEIARFCDGDARKSLNLLSLLSIQKSEVLKDENQLKQLFQQQRAYDKNQQRHYDVISAFIKSIRGSDPDAAVLWLAVMLDGGEDPEFIARRLMILASEDVGLANSQALQVACNAHYVTKNIGMPEARITLSHATIFMALSPKSNAAYTAVDEALGFVKENPTLQVPDYLSNIGPAKKQYKYPHSFPMHFVAQSYRPPEASLMRFYKPGTIGSEGAMNEIWKKFTHN